MSRQRKKAEQLPVEIGEDGWPVGERNAEAEAAEHRVWIRGLERHHRMYLDLLRQCAIEDLYFPALMDALEFCLRQNLPLPDWLGQEIEALLSLLYSSKKRMWRRGEGMTAKRDMHVRRYAEIEEARIHGVKWDAKEGDGDIFEVASGYIDEKPSTIRASYKKVASAMKSGNAHEFYVARYRRRPIGVKKTQKKP